MCSVESLSQLQLTLTMSKCSPCVAACRRVRPSLSLQAASACSTSRKYLRQSSFPSWAAKYTAFVPVRGEGRGGEGRRREGRGGEGREGEGRGGGGVPCALIKYILLHVPCIQGMNAYTSPFTSGEENANHLQTNYPHKYECHYTYSSFIR